MKTGIPRYRKLNVREADVPDCVGREFDYLVARKDMMALIETGEQIWETYEGSVGERR